MKIKAFLLFVIGAVFLSMNNLWAKIAQVEVNSSLALEQFANPSIETDSALRVVNAFNPGPYLIAVFVVVAVLMFRRELVNLFNQIKGEEIENR